MERGAEEVEEGVGLKQLVSALLPPESRENILGDLEERGFRLGEMISVTLTARFTAFLRDWTGKVPDLSSADDAAIELRIDRLRQSGRILLCCLMTTFAVSISELTKAPIRLWWVLCLWLLLLLFLPALPVPPGSTRERYRNLLRGRQSSLLAHPLLLLSTVSRLVDRPGRAFVFVAGIVIAAPLVIRRSMRLKQELSNSPEPMPVPRIFP